jgi:hypothetical protein
MMTGKKRRKETEDEEEAAAPAADDAAAPRKKTKKSATTKKNAKKPQKKPQKKQKVAAAGATTKKKAILPSDAEEGSTSEMDDTSESVWQGESGSDSDSEQEDEQQHAAEKGPLNKCSGDAVAASGNSNNTGTVTLAGQVVEVDSPTEDPVSADEMEFGTAPTAHEHATDAATQHVVGTPTTAAEKPANIPLEQTVGGEAESGKTQPRRSSRPRSDLFAATMLAELSSQNSGSKSTNSTPVT